MWLKRISLLNAVKIIGILLLFIGCSPIYSTFATLDYSLEAGRKELKGRLNPFSEPILKLNEHVYLVIFPERYYVNNKEDKCIGTYQRLFLRIWVSKDLYVDKDYSKLTLTNLGNKVGVEITSRNGNSGQGNQLKLKALSASNFRKLSNTFNQGEYKNITPEGSNVLEIAFDEPVSCDNANFDISLKMFDSISNSYTSKIYFFSTEYTKLNR
jgi:hypothetical protein